MADGNDAKPLCIITGANTGIGKETAKALAAHGYRLLLACRSRPRTEPVVEELNREHGAGTAEFLALDLADLSSVRRSAADVHAPGTPIKLLVNNAGVAGQRGLTADGFELAFGINHLGHFLFTNLLLDLVCEAAPARIVTVSSKAHYRARGIPYDRLRQPTRSFTGLPEYEVSKLANVLFSAELAKRVKDRGVTTYSLHPGVIASDIWRRIPGPARWALARILNMKSTVEGAQTSIHCCIDPAAGKETGLYYSRSQPKAPNPLADDPAVTAELWEKSEAFTVGS